MNWRFAAGCKQRAKYKVFIFYWDNQLSQSSALDGNLEWKYAQCDLRRHYTSVSWYEALRNRWLCAASIMLREWKHEYISSSSRAHAALHFIMDGPLRKRLGSRSATPLRLQRVAEPVQGGRPDNEMCSRWTRCTAEIIDFCAFDKNTTD